MRRLARMLAGVALVLSACDPPPDNEPIPATDALRAIQGTSWLVRRVTLEVPTRSRWDQWESAGFDIDAFDAGEDGDPDGNCDAFMPDRVSELDRGITGVDNALAFLVQAAESYAEHHTTFEGALDGAMREGRIRWAVRVGDLDEDETSVALELFLVDPTETLATGEDGMPAPGQRLRALFVAETRGSVRRHVAWGRVEPTALPGTGDVFVLPFDDFRLGAFGVAAESPDVLRGSVGGSFSLDVLASTAMPLIVPQYQYAVRPTLDASGDLQPSVEDPTICERISVGFGFEAVPVELVTD